MTIVMCKSYDTLEQARQVRQALLEAGFPAKSIGVIDPGILGQGAEARSDAWPFMADRNLDRQGSFADVEPASHDRNLERKGSFADAEPAIRDRNLERQGSFADADPTYYDRNAERKGTFADREPEAVDGDGLAEALRRAGLSAPDADREARAVRGGATLILVQTPSGSMATAAQLLGTERDAAT